MAENPMDSVSKLRPEERLSHGCSRINTDKRVLEFLHPCSIGADPWLRQERTPVATDPFIIAGKPITPTSEIPLFTGSLVSIIIPCCGMLEYTKLCVPSVLKHSRQPFELIFLDIGSLDGMVQYLAGLTAALGPPLPVLRERAGVRVRVGVVRAATDLDIKDACKEALAGARGEYVVLLNNDTVVTSGWLNSSSLSR